MTSGMSCNVTFGMDGIWSVAFGVSFQTNCGIWCLSWHVGCGMWFMAFHEWQVV